MEHAFTNDLVHETSPYLLQHAHNPVNWKAWNEATLDVALSSGKPIILSIGYSACHWCHVMEHESFEDETVAAYMNEHFINIKVDREERPDVDHLYMDAVQLVAGNGGWPLNVFLTPDKKPMYGGTYYPPKPAFSRPSWMQVLQSVKDAWGNRRHEMEAQADNIVDHLQKQSRISPPNIIDNIPGTKYFYSREDCKEMAAQLLKSADTIEGGFGKAPKFPQTFSIIYLLRQAHFYGDKNALAQAELSLAKMYHGGIYDQLGGGFARYSTDERWLAPHFEKMLYDNALIIAALAEAAMLTGKGVYAEAISHTTTFLQNNLLSAEGGYYAALDADSEGEEGKYYVWSSSEINEVLGNDAAFFSSYYNIIPGGNWENKNILHVTRNLEEVAVQFKLDVSKAKEILENSREVLLAIRSSRIPPGLDDKIILGWNALLVSAFCKAFKATLDENYKTLALELFHFLEEKFASTESGSMFHGYSRGEAKIAAFLDDYAFYIEACCLVQEISGDSAYLGKGKKALEYVEKYFTGGENALYYFTSDLQKDVLVRKQEIYDGALPSSNAIMARNLLYLGRIYDNREWMDKSYAMQIAVKAAVIKHPGSFGCWAADIQKEVSGVLEIVLTGQEPQMLLNECLNCYIPNSIFQSSKSTAAGFPLLENKLYIRQTQIYVCQHQACLQPVHSKNGLIDVVKSTLFNNLTDNN
ncbi:MAG: thioredoxin domain-containing protein [Ferruginibacter sp.]